MDFVNIPQILKLFENENFICERLQNEKECRYSYSMLTFEKKKKKINGTFDSR